MDELRGALCLGARELARIIVQASERVILAAPNLHWPVAEALVAAQARMPGRVLVILDTSPAMFRLGFGELSALERLMEARVPTLRHQGVRLGCLLADDEAFFFAPTPHLVEAEPDFAQRRNGFRMLAEQAYATLRSLADGDALEGVLKGHPVSAAQGSEPGSVIQASAFAEPQSTPVTVEEVEIVKQDLEGAPPQPFDVSRQLRVYQAHLLYVELEMKGCQFQTRRYRIPQALYPASPDPRIREKFETTFLIDVSNLAKETEAVEAKLEKLRKDLARDLRYPFDRVVLRRKSEAFEAAVEVIQTMIAEAQTKVEASIEDVLKTSLEQVVSHCLPLFLSHPPPGNWVWKSPDDARNFLREKISETFPSAHEMARKMKLHVFQRDLTYETLRNPELLLRLKRVFPEHPWDKAHAESIAAAGRKSS